MGAMLRSRLAGMRYAQTRGLRATGETEPVNFSDYGVAGQPITQEVSDLARALAFQPVLLELLDSFIRPGHRRLVRQFRSQNKSPSQNPAPPPNGSRRLKTRTSTLSEAVTTTSRGLTRKKYTTR
jgi:hypothetical protein